MKFRFYSVLMLLSMFLAFESVAQDGGLITDRPDFTESPNAVSVGTIQVELGGTSETTDSFTANTFGEALVRYGIFDKFELRVGIPSLISGDFEDSGLSDASIGLKWQAGSLGENAEVGVIGFVTLPTGDDMFTSDGVDPSVIVTAGTSLTDNISLGTQIQGSYNTAGDDRQLDWDATVVLGLPVAGRIGAFAEIAASAPEVGDSQALFHFGFVIAMGDNAQIDVHGGTGLTDETPDSFFGAGFSFRR